MEDINYKNNPEAIKEMTVQYHPKNQQMDSRAEWKF